MGRKGCGLLAAALLVLLGQQVEGCPVVHVRSPRLPFLEGAYLLTEYGKRGEAEPKEGEEAVLYAHNERPVYVSAAEPYRYLYHMQVGEDEGGRWMIGAEVGINSAWAFVESWALTPNLVTIVSERAVYQVFDAEEDGGVGAWLTDHEFGIDCEGTDTTVYFSSTKAPLLSGLYVELGETNSGRAVFQRSDLYLYSSGCCMWILGEKVGDMNGLAFIEAEVEHPMDLAKASGEHQWNVAVEGHWVVDPGFEMITSDPDLCLDMIRRRHGGEGVDASAVEDDAHLACGHRRTTFEIMHALRDDRKAQVPASRLPGGTRVPFVGFGTGAMPRDQIEGSVTMALDAGYKLLDSASVYDNEDIIGGILASEDAKYDREELFIISKNWYTELGYQNTIQAAERSLRRLRTGYIDLYLIHWPACYPEIQWMDCSTQSGGTWQQSWRALEKLYAEGKATAIGVSNFHEGLMADLLDLASTTPHVVQNYLDPAHTDPVVDICREEGIFYQSYSTLRALMQPKPEADYQRPATLLKKIADKLKKSPAQVGLRWLVQQGIGVIPRSSRVEHIKANLDLFSWEIPEEDLSALNVALGMDAVEQDDDGRGGQGGGSPHEEL